MPDPDARLISSSGEPGGREEVFFAVLKSRIWRRLGLVLALLVASTIPATAATAINVPFGGPELPTIVRSGAGPFTWTYTSETGRGTAYMLETDTGWHRCQPSPLNVTLSNLPDGTYVMEATDDSVGPCDMSGDPLGITGYPYIAPSTSTLIVDSTPPTVSPTVALIPPTSGSLYLAYLYANASDSGSGVATYSWDFGTTASATGQTGASANQLYYPGTYSGSVTATDKAGNSTTASFTVTIPKSPSSTPASTTAPVKATSKPTKRTLPRLSLLRARAGLVTSIENRTGLPAKLRLSCRRESRTAFRCSASWMAKGNLYAVSAAVTEARRARAVVTSYAVSGKVAAAKCVRRHGRSCTRSFHWRSS
jgi:uncharacterized protein (DUF2141 family)